ncbi:CHAT domain-containing protein [Falsiroseomonas sp.]|uniref:CHAT domain-containing protein n=1 Tax=Falsiroseomonas sp. TaxID=2870721 RepID=UPI003F71CD3C
MAKDQETQKPGVDENDGGAEGDVRARQVRGRADVVAEFKDFIARNPGIFGGADILNIDYLRPLERAGMLAAVLTGISGDDRRPAVRAFVIVAPPETDVETAREKAWGELLSAYHLLAGREMAPTPQEWFKKRFQVIAAPDWRSASVVEILKAQPERAAAIVTDAAVYRDDRIEPYVAPGSATPLLPQDVWVPQVHALAVAAVDVARERNVYVALDTDQLTPTREVLSDRLLSIDGCGVLGSSNEADLGTVLTARAGQWDTWIREGRVGQALREIDDLPPSFDGQKAFLRIQMLHRAGLLPEALRAIRHEMSPERKLDASSRVKLARIAQDANASLLASEVLGPTVSELNYQEDLESALATAHDTGSAELEEKFAARLAKLFPGSPGVRQRQRRALVAARNYAGVAAMLACEANGQPEAKFFTKLAQSLSGAETPDYSALIASADDDTILADAFRMACVRDALQRQLVFHAFELALPLPKTPAHARRGERLLIEVLEAILLFGGKGGALPVPGERVQSAVLELIDRLAGDTTNQTLRVGLASLVQPSVAGTAGLALMASVVLRLASRPVTLDKRETPGKARMDWLLERKSFLSGAFGWLQEQQPVVISRVTLPKALLTEPADEVVSAVTHYLSHFPVASSEDVTALQLWLTFATSVTPHSTDPDFDLRLMRLVAGKLASSGHPQLARDLTEQALMNSAATPRRRRLGWFVMADVYHRCHNYLEGLLALACTLAADDTADEEQVWQEVTAVARFLRDCGLLEHAQSAIHKARQLLNNMGLSATYRHRLDTLELQIRQVALQVNEAGNADLEALLKDAVVNGAAVLQHHDMTEPAAALLGQLLRLGKERQASIPENAKAVFSDLCERAGGRLASLINTMSEPSVSARDLFDLVGMSEPARYSEDVGYDMRNLAMVAGRALSDEKYIQHAVQTSFALELLADRGVAMPGWDEAAEPPAAPRQLEEPAEIACAVSRDAGVSVVQAGFDASGRLVRVSAVGGNLEPPIRELDDVFHEARFRAWAVDYPYQYGIDESTPNLFYTTTADLKLSSLPKGPIVVAADATLQPFPPNLLYVGDNFAGRTRPMAAVPSLAWLKAARDRGPIGDGRLCAWISTAVGGSGSETLPMIAQRLEPTFAEHAFTVDNGATLPATFAGATMAVITAHGGVHPEGRYFQVVSDEGGLRVAAGDLAGALRNVGVVILFVCSGGRADKHPGAHTTLGLAKQILDRGSQSVIASPWPLDSRVPSHWLPTFLERWLSGETLIEANFAANQVVDRNFAYDPARGLAMTIFGDPTMRRLT